MDIHKSDDIKRRQHLDKVVTNTEKKQYRRERKQHINKVSADMEKKQSRYRLYFRQ